MRFWFQKHCNQSSYVIETEGQLQCWYIWTSNQQNKYYLFTSFIQTENESSISLDLDFKLMVNIVINHLTSSKQKDNYQCWYIWTSNQQKFQKNFNWKKKLMGPLKLYFEQSIEKKSKFLFIIWFGRIRPEIIIIGRL